MLRIFKIFIMRIDYGLTKVFDMKSFLQQR